MLILFDTSLKHRPTDKHNYQGMACQLSRTKIIQHVLVARFLLSILTVPVYTFTWGLLRAIEDLEVDLNDTILHFCLFRFVAVLLSLLSFSFQCSTFAFYMYMYSPSVQVYPARRTYVSQKDFSRPLDSKSASLPSLSFRPSNAWNLENIRSQMFVQNVTEKT